MAINHSTSKVLIETKTDSNIDPMLEALVKMLVASIDGIVNQPNPQLAILTCAKLSAKVAEAGLETLDYIAPLLTGEKTLKEILAEIYDNPSDPRLKIFEDFFEKFDKDNEEDDPES